MNPFKTLLLITLTLGFTACSDKDKSRGVRDGVASNTTVNTTVPTLTNTTTPPTIDPNTPSTYKSLTLTAEQTTLNKDDNTTLKLTATYPDNTTKELNTDIEYAITPNASAEVNNNTLTAKQDGTLTLQAKTGNTLSSVLTLTVTWIVGGHTLPPEPDKEENDKTLLGIDSNNNGVRDDVERAIYEKFPQEIRRQQLIQLAKSHQSLLADEDAIANAQKWQNIIANKDIACSKYLFDTFDIDFNLEADAYMENVLYNTKERVFKYVRYNHALGGGVYFTPESMVNERSCEFDVSKALKADK